MNTKTNIIKLTPPIVRVLQKGKTVVLAGAVGLTVILIGMPFGAFALDSGKSAAMDWMNNEKHVWHLAHPKKSETVEKTRGKTNPAPSLFTNEKHSWHMKRTQKP